DDPRDRGGDQAVEGTGEVVFRARGNRRVGKGALRAVPTIYRQHRCLHGGHAALCPPYCFAPSRLLKLSTLTRPRAWRPSPILRSPSKASTSNRITRRSTAITFAVVRTVAPTSEAPRCLIS